MYKIIYAFLLFSKFKGVGTFNVNTKTNRKWFYFYFLTATRAALEGYTNDNIIHVQQSHSLFYLFFFLSSPSLEVSRGCYSCIALVV